ncbi:hypothetical protein [Streptomyces niveus]|uniref:Uncharacterized protein n=1 Tax=Streptomyces niveus TaxID=193462 RepID=A0ABZ2A827_STRNV|nr:hypothetical protein [Streptomyces niveus]
MIRLTLAGVALGIDQLAAQKAAAWSTVRLITRRPLAGGYPI